LNENIKILILTLSSIIGGGLTVDYGYEIIGQEKISIWIFMLLGIFGAVLTWLIIGFLIDRIKNSR